MLLKRQSTAPLPNFTHILREDGLGTSIPDIILRACLVSGSHLSVSVSQLRLQCKCWVRPFVSYGGCLVVFHTVFHVIPQQRQSSVWRELTDSQRPPDFKTSVVRRLFSQVPQLP